jgi:hypothetical protein
MKFLKGKKTYVVAALAILLNFAVYMNWLTVDQLTQVNAVLAFLGIATVRAGITGK